MTETTDYNKYHLLYEGMSDEPNTMYPHRYVRGLGSYRGGPFVTGSGPNYSQSQNLKTELLDMHDPNYWQEQQEYPYANDNQ